MYKLIPPLNPRQEKGIIGLYFLNLLYVISLFVFLYYRYHAKIITISSLEPMTQYSAFPKFILYYILS